MTLQAGACPRCRTGVSTTHRWDTDRRPVERIRGRHLQAMRRRLFATEPLCRECRANGRDTVATIRDHIIPLGEGGPDDETNEQPLCQSCSDRKTQQESIRGRNRG